MRIIQNRWIYSTDTLSSQLASSMNHPANIPPPNWQEGRKPGRCPSMFPRLPLLFWHECDCELFVLYSWTGQDSPVQSPRHRRRPASSCLVSSSSSTRTTVAKGVWLGSWCSSILVFSSPHVVLRMGVEASCRFPVLAL